MSKIKKIKKTVTEWAVTTGYLATIGAISITANAPRAVAQIALGRVT